MRLLPVVPALLLLLLSPACDKPIPVAPSGSTISVSANPTRIEIDGSSEITALARKEDGQPVNPGTEVIFYTDLGTIDEVAKTDDRGVAKSTLVGDGRIGLATVGATSGAAGEATVEVQIGSLANSITLQATPSSLPREGGEIELLALVRDDVGQPLEGAVVNFLTEVGTLDSGGSALLTNAAGEAEDRLTVTENDLAAWGDSTFFVEVQTGPAEEGGELQFDDAEIQVFGGADSISLQATPGSIPATGGQVSLLAVVQDDLGAPVEGAGVTFSAEVGTLASGGSLVTTNSAGEARDTLTATAGDLSAVTNRFTVTASVVVGGTSESDTFEILVQADTPTAAFDFTTTTGSLEVVFDNQSVGEAPLSYLWNFGDGSTSTAEEPTHTYGQASSFTVTLTASNLLGSDSVTQEVDLRVTPPVAGFTFAAGSAALQVDFTNTTTGDPPIEYEWDFENDGTVDSTNEDASHIYTAAGNYTVKLTARNPGGIDDAVQTITVPLP